MDFRGISILQDVGNLQPQIDALNVRVTALETLVSTINGEIVTINGQITSINSTLATITTELDGVNTKLDQLDDSAVGNFTPFNVTFSSGGGNITPNMSPVQGDGLFIPYSHLTDGMCLRITLYTTMQVNPSQDLVVHLSQDDAGGYPWTSEGYETQPVLVDPTGRIWTFVIQLINITHGAFNSYTVTGNGRVGYFSGNARDLFDEDGLRILFFAFWRVDSGVANFTVNNFTVEKIANFFAT